MIRDYIKYEKLSHEIKSEIMSFHDEQQKTGASPQLEESMVRWFEQHFDRWLLVRSGGGDGDKRKHYRVEVEVPISFYETLIESGGDAEAEEYVGKMVNVSRGGLYFKSNRPIKVSSIIRVRIDLSAIEPTLQSLEALAMVIRVDQQENGEYGIGLLFSSIYEDDRNHLEVFILKNLAYFIYS